MMDSHGYFSFVSCSPKVSSAGEACGGQIAERANLATQLDAPTATYVQYFF